MLVIKSPDMVKGTISIKNTGTGERTTIPVKRVCIPVELSSFPVPSPVASTTRKREVAGLSLPLSVLCDACERESVCVSTQQWQRALKLLNCPLICSLLFPQLTRRDESESLIVCVCVPVIPSSTQTPLFKQHLCHLSPTLHPFHWTSTELIKVLDSVLLLRQTLSRCQV